MPAGGARPGSGRLKGRKQTVSNQARKEAAAAGLLPHEWLLKVARGEPIPHKQWKIIYDRNGNELSRELVEVEVYADFATRIDAAKAAAPYYAPRLATQQVKLEQPGNTSGVMLVPVMSQNDWAKMAVKQQTELKNDVKS
jgi:hypothetical protein